jgi:hypothetical protein
LLDGNNPKGCIHGVLFEKMIANMWLLCDQN